MKNNKITLKSLKEELESLKGQNAKASNPKNIKVQNTTSRTRKLGILTNIRKSLIPRFYRQSSGFLLFVITGVLGYIHKVPLLSKVFSIITFWYGKTTFIKIIIKIRKFFVIFNALIGMYVVFNTVGFEPGLLLANYIAVGEAYVTIFTNFCKRIFYWLFDLFDHKIVPNIPSSPSGKPSNPFNFNNSSPSWWSPKDYNPHNPFNTLSPNSEFSLRDLYKSPNININLNTTPWYKDWSSLLWIGGGIFTVGTIYLGYKLWTDPMCLYNWLTVKAEDITPTDTRSKDTILNDSSTNYISHGISTIGSLLKSSISKLNPLSWIPVSSEYKAQYEAFLYQQESVNYNRHYYPFTSNNPYDSWFAKLKLHYLGESTSDLESRIRMKREIINNLTNVGPGSSTIPNSPVISSIGLGIKNVSGSTFMEQVEASSSHATVSDKLFSVPNTPKTTPTIPAIEITDWEKADRSHSATDVYNSLRGWRFNHKRLPFNEVAKDNTSNTASIPQIKLEDLATPNKYSVLNIE